MGILSLIFSNAFVTDAGDLSCIGTAYAYLLNTSITVRIYLNPLLKEEKACMSTKSADHISSLLKTITDRVGNFLLIGLCNSSANFSFQLFFLPKPSWYLLPVIALTIIFLLLFLQMFYFHWKIIYLTYFYHIRF